ncbi:alpha-(1,6)-fucosyltransferase-like isoform X1 [Mya arenaria]|uniref:alpha-(1,6)-fucosyltransferase-like isoform X1 n=1 Tax=Mya arenaria TaxID=6604 RepID=UPI0022E352BB|nr:alpha-(1,6)-fucosyltransferase-like isoform X1 [Mya arenaria]
MSLKHVLCIVASLYIFISLSILIIFIVTTDYPEDTSTSYIPDPKYEDARRETRRLSQEMWMYMDSQLKRLISQSVETETESIKDILAFGSHLHTAILSAHDTLEDEFEKWRNLRSNEVSRFVQEQLDSIQNPLNCSTADMFVCKLDKTCGFGCQMHHVTYCLMVAYATNRTMVLVSKGWRYSKTGWDTVFRPLSKTCHENHPDVIKRMGHLTRLQIVDLNTGNDLPLAVPDILLKCIQHFHGHPGPWWVGQFVRYIFRPNHNLEESLKNKEKRFTFDHPIVGIQVRRTDKLDGEASFHSLQEYMIHVERWFDVAETKTPTVQRKVYLATDDPSLFREAEHTYPTYSFIGDVNISISAQLSSRYTLESLKGVITDVHFLSMCDYIVCTLSSQICRLAYEIMQTKHGDLSSRVKSLDDIYYFSGGSPERWIAMYDHDARNEDEFSFKAGDTIQNYGNHWDGYSKGKHLRSGNEGLFPSYKVKRFQ